MTTSNSYPLAFDRLFKPRTPVGSQAIADNRAAVEYNGFKFPPALRATASVTPVMDDSGRMTKYAKIDLKVTCYLFHGLNLGSTGTVASPGADNLYGGSYKYTDNIPLPADCGITNFTFTTDAEMDNVRKRLTEPCQQLLFTYQGLGTVSVNDFDQSQNVVPAKLDVDNGPKPKLVTWRPIGNKCCYIEWEVSTCISPCATDLRSIAQFPFTVDYGIGRSGLTTRTISGDVEIALTRKPDSTTTHAGASIVPSIGSQDFHFSDSQQFIINYFPLLSGYHREQKYNLSDDRKHVHFSLVDSEIDSDEAFGEGCVDEEVSLETNNKYPMVFSIWDVSLSGHIELAAGFPKRFALAEIARLFHRYYSVCAFTGDFIHRTSSGASSEGSEEADDDKGAAQTSLAKETNASYPILQSIRFTDHLFSRKVDFSINWSLYTTLQTIFAATGMFVPARDYTTDGTFIDDYATAQRNAWGLWRTSLGQFLDAGGFQGLDFSASDDIIISLCQDPIGGENVPQDLNIQFDPIGTDERDSDTREHKNSWHTFEPRFHLERKEHTHPHSPLSNYKQPLETAKAPDLARESEDYVPAESSYGDPTQSDTLVHSRREPSHILHFSGYAIRLNLPVPEPNVEFYGHRPGVDAEGNVDPQKADTPIPVTRIGTSTLKPQFIGTGTDLTTGKSYKIYGLAWHKTYALPTAPLSSKIVTDGHKDIFIG